MNPTAPKWFATTLRGVLALFSLLTFIFAFGVYYSIDPDILNLRSLSFVCLLIWGISSIISVFHFSLKESWATLAVPINLSLTLLLFLYIASQINSPLKSLIIIALLIFGGLFYYWLYGTQSAKSFWALNSNDELPLINIFSQHNIEIKLEKSIQYAIVGFTVILSIVLCFDYII